METVPIVQTRAVMDGTTYTILTEPPGTRLMNFIIGGEDSCYILDHDEYDCNCGEEFLYQIAHPYISYVFYYSHEYNNYKLEYVLFSNDVPGQANLCFAPLPNIYDDSICMPNKDSASMVELIGNFWQTQFNYDGGLEEFSSWGLIQKLLPKGLAWGDRREAYEWWEQNLTIDNLLGVEWPEDFCFEDFETVESEW